MRDGIAAARLGLPSVALVTEAFWPQGDFVAASLGMPDAPRVRLPHPVSGTGRENIDRVAGAVVEDVIAALRGAP